MSTDITAFLPGASDAKQRLIINQLSDGISTRLVVIGLSLPEDGTAENKTAERLREDRQALTLMSNRLRERLAAVDAIAWVSNGNASHHRDERDQLFNARYQLSPGVSPNAFTIEGLRDSFLALQNELISASGALIRPIAAADPTLESLRVLAQGSGSLGSMRENGDVWFSEDSRTALLVFTTVANGQDVTAVNAAIDRARAEAEAVLQDWPAEADDSTAQAKLTPSVGFAGSGYFNAASQRAIGSDALTLVLLALVLISSLILWALRSPRLLLLALLPVASGALVAYAVVGLGYGSIHATTIGFGVTLLGEAVDYVIYTAVQRGEDGRHSSQFWSKFRLAVLTSLVGFAAMVLSGFQGLQQLGLFSIVGLIAAALCTRFLIPDLLGAPVRTPRRDNRHTKVLPFLPAIARRARVLRWPIIIATIIASVWLHERAAPLWQDSLEVLSSSSVAKSNRDMQWRGAINQPDLRSKLVVHGEDLEQALLRAENLQTALVQLVNDGRLTTFYNPAVWLPSTQTQTSRLAALPKPEQLRERIAQAVGDTQLRASALEPFVTAVASARAKGPLTLEDYDGTITGDWLNAQTVRSGDGVHLLVLLHGAPPAAALDTWLAELALPGVTVLNFQREIESLVATYRMKALLAALIGAAGIVAMLAWRVRDVGGVSSMVVTLTACVVLTSSVLAAGSVSLSVFHLVALLLVVGVVSNYTLFFASLPRDTDECRRVSLSVVLAASATIIAFSMLAWSSTPLLAMIGSTVAIGGVIGLAASLVFSREETAAIASRNMSA